MFYERVKELRLSHKMSQVEFSHKISTSKQVISNWENDYATPALDMFQKICETFSVSADYLLGIESQNFLDVSGLSMEQIAHLQNIVNDLKAVNSEK
ncbi:MAG: helix-turn-helix transcriptional regulator [Oscillospiraceae bacterium]|nr:helix-turn-helix transcriptional regulator [Oscillospiraceae bacterium]